VARQVGRIKNRIVLILAIKVDGISDGDVIHQVETENIDRIETVKPEHGVDYVAVENYVHVIIAYPKFKFSIRE